MSFNLLLEPAWVATDLRCTLLHVTLFRGPAYPAFLDLQHTCPQLTLIVHHCRLYRFAGGGQQLCIFSCILYVSHEP
jgi:hypothetical protein